jgi:hypothetical protein
VRQKVSARDAGADEAEEGRESGMTGMHKVVFVRMGEDQGWCLDREVSLLSDRQLLADKRLAEETWGPGSWLFINLDLAAAELQTTFQAKEA